MSADNATALHVESGHIYYTAILLSLLLHALLFVSFGGQATGITESSQPQTIRLSLLAPPPEPVEHPKATPEPEPKKPDIKPEPKPLPKVVEQPLQELAPEPLRDVVQTVVPKPEVKPQQLTIAPSLQVQPDEGLIRRERERYLARVLSHVEKYKWYPGLARRRGIEGDVTVSFTMHHDGSVHDLVIENGPPLLMDAARRTVEKALPVPKPPAAVDCPLECKFRLSFHLKQS